MPKACKASSKRVLLLPCRFYGTGYVPQAKWYQWGFLFSVLYLAVWVFVGGPWYKAIGIF